MAKKLITVWLSLTVLLFSTITIYAEENVQGYFLNRNININGNQVANYYLDNPLFLYLGVTYFPLNEQMGELLGFKAEMDWESRTLKILKKEPLQTLPVKTVLKNNLINPKAVALENFSVLMMTEVPDSIGADDGETGKSDQNAAIMPTDVVSPLDLIPIPELNVREFSMENYNLLQVGDTLYFPVRALTGETGLGWDVYFDNYSGIYISTDRTIAAATYFDQTEANYNKGLASYIRAKNKSVSETKSLDLVFLFKHEADVHKVDEILLMAMAQKESTFRTDAVGSGKGPVGLMQIMPATAKHYGIDRSQLFDPHVNIEFGAKYIGSKMVQYNDKNIALTAYNQGGAAISRGGYDTRYAGRITSAEESLKNYLVNNGYGLGE